MDYKIIPLDRRIFRAYDIRGIVGEQINEDVFYTIGRAISVRLHELERRQIFLARDGRLQSERLANALAQGVLDGGIDLLNLGEVATPLLYYATHINQHVDCGLMVTGSHNPANYNGIKIVLAGKTLVATDLEQLYKIVVNGVFPGGKGNAQDFQIIDNYITRIINDITIDRSLKVVVDCGNGVAGPVVLRVLKELGLDIVALYCDVDGRFPNHHPDPSVETNLIDLKNAVAKHQADLGIAFDGDADRLGVVANDGNVIWPDRLLMLFARHVLQNNKNATIVYDVKCSNHLATVIGNAGGIGKMCPSGHSIVKAFLKKEKAILAGELSGHIFFEDRWYGFDDALYSSCRLLEIISKNAKSVSEQFAMIPNSVNTPEIKIPIAEEKKFIFMQNFSKQAKFPDGKPNLIDGVRVEFTNGWGLLRASNTTPCLIARFEATDHQNLERIQELFRAQLMRVDQELEFTF